MKVFSRVVAKTVALLSSYCRGWYVEAVGGPSVLLGCVGLVLLGKETQWVESAAGPYFSRLTRRGVCEYLNTTQKTVRWLVRFTA